MQQLKVPLSGTPTVIIDNDELAHSLNSLRKGHGPIAIDAERASGYKFSQRAYLIQIFRRGGGLHLLDPIALEQSPLIEILNSEFEDCEWIIHASTQDLPSLREFGISPKKLFDTELAARIAGFPRFGLAALCESLLEISLAKEHSAVDWSTRPLPKEWIDYAALDVEVLVDLRDRIRDELVNQNKLSWVEEDCAAILNTPPPAPRKEPWRRTSGMHQIKNRAELAIVHSLWQARHQIARERDIAPGRLLADAIIVEAAKLKPQSKNDFLQLPQAKNRLRRELQRELIDTWVENLLHAYQLPESQWPELRAPGSGMPHPKGWENKFPLAYAHLTHAKARLIEISSNLGMPTENLISPDLVRKVCFDQGREERYHDRDLTLERVREVLESSSARRWQIEQIEQVLAQALLESEPLIVDEPIAESVIDPSTLILD